MVLFLPDRHEMEDCGHLPTPGVPDGYETRCVEATTSTKVKVTVVATNPLGSSTTVTYLLIHNEGMDLCKGLVKSC